MQEPPRESAILVIDVGAVRDLHPSKVYAYADETTFSMSNGQEMVGAAVLLTRSPIDADLITGALARLYADPDRAQESRVKLDDLTLQRGYFHASEDSANAHSHLCRAISQTVAGKFIHFYYDRSHARLLHKAADTGLANAALQIALLETLDDHESIELFIEAREDNAGFAARLKDKLYRHQEVLAYDFPRTPQRFPSISTTVVDKSSPGAQVVDFLLWAMDRDPDPRSTKDSWRNRVGLRLSSAHSRDDGYSRGGNYWLGREWTEPSESYPESWVVQLPGSQQGLQCAYGILERSVRGFARALPSHASHLQSDLDALCTELERSTMRAFRGEPLVAGVATAFIRLFDTVPLYEGIQEDDDWTWQLYGYVKRLATFLLQKREAHAMHLLAYLSRYRRTVNAQEPEYLRPKTDLG